MKVIKNVTSSFITLIFNMILIFSFAFMVWFSDQAINANAHKEVTLAPGN